MTLTRTAPHLLLVGLIAGALAAVPVAPDAPAVAAGHAPRITVEDLGTLGGLNAEAVAVNERGQVVGTSWMPGGDTHAFLWEDGQMRDLGTLGGDASGARAINDRGQVVGWAEDADGVPHAVLWEGDEIRDIGGPWTMPRGLSEHGHVALAGPSDGYERAARVWHHGTVTDVGPLDEAYPDTSVTDMSRDGAVTGYGSVGRQYRFHGFLWRDGELVDLGSPAGPDGRSHPVAVDDAGQVLAAVSPDSTTQSYAIWQDGTWTPLPPLGADAVLVDMNENGTAVGKVRGAGEGWDAVVVRDGDVIEMGSAGWSTWAELVNDAEQVVGRASADVQLAMLWQDGRMHELPPLFEGGETAALDLSERGQVAGYANTPDGETHAVLWTISGRS